MVTGIIKLPMEITMKRSATKVKPRLDDSDMLGLVSWFIVVTILISGLVSYLM